MDSDPELLRLVFSFHVIDQIMHADEHLDDQEIDWVRVRFPRERLADNGLIDDEDVLTPRYRDLLAEALMRLPAELDRDAKLALIHEFFEGALADGSFEVREGNRIVVAARLLGLPLREVDGLLDGEHFGELDLGEPEASA